MLARLISAAIVLTGCSFVDSPGPLGGSVTVTGEVVDFQTGAAINTAASITTAGLSPVPRVSSRGAAFTIEGILENSAFQILATAPPNHRATFSPAVVVTTADLDGVKAPVVAETLLANLATALRVTPTASKGVVFVRLVDGAGQPRAGVAATDFTITGADGPHFLDAALTPAAATASSASGWAVFFEVPVGVVALAQPATAAVTIDMPAVAVTAATVTIAQGTVSAGAPLVPRDVRFATQIVPIFRVRGCEACHSGNGIGKDLGGLTLDGGSHLIYKELVEERPNTRVNTATPEMSKVLTMPSREDPPDRHPNVTFTGPRDPDYLKLLIWIREGAKEN